MERYVIFLALCCLVSAGCSKPGTAEASAQTKGGARGARGDAAVSVLVAKASARDVPIQAEVIGNVEASSTVTLRPQISGQLVQAHFQEGQFVNKGQLLLTVDRRVLDAQLRQLESQIRRDEAAVGQASANLARDHAQEANARAQLERANKLLKEGILSKEQYDQYSTALATLEATVKADEAAVENSKGRDRNQPRRHRNSKSTSWIHQYLCANLGTHRYSADETRQHRNGQSDRSSHDQPGSASLRNVRASRSKPGCFAPT